jgi:hypothetical protein
MMNRSVLRHILHGAVGGPFLQRNHMALSVLFVESGLAAFTQGRLCAVVLKFLVKLYDLVT